MNAYRSEDNSYCYFHPKEDLVGICPLCLNERLLVLATKKSSRSSARATRGNEGTAHRKPPIKLTKIFAFGSLLNRFEFRHWKSDNSDQDAASTSQEGKFCCSCCSCCCYLLLLLLCGVTLLYRLSLKTTVLLCGKKAQFLRSLSSLAASHGIKISARKPNRVAKEDWSYVPANDQKEEVQQRTYVPRGYRGGGRQGEEGLDKDPDKEENQRIKRFL
ncbi:hypothetical protein DKX38_002392 [Salix brachista]|uniref:Uncharacterized protein n=1 Tax=Salix brachista TaxID=2182728 RepID=A0A5N5NN56_9ROSI|nr:hypothetical protein DKX38_002392 [Salix brachista]